MPRDLHHQVILAEMARAVRAGHPDADWHEIEPALRDIWEHAPRQTSWESVRGDAAHHWRFGASMPPSATVLEPGPSETTVPATPESLR